MEADETLSPIVTELLLSGRNLNISLAFISQSYFKVPKTIRLNTTHFFIMKIPNKGKLQQITNQRCFTRKRFVRKSCYNKNTRY